ncbi:uncharacterized protein LACBIDRAFT_310185 [Laccaria bicolor S238N-H82]|uniref:Predicted protein n=1 Tax=Laccaria bicolor (strain S238N-H82 / ATCC MYA-4686) TaxID=486041 RepID=B0DU16_LACBS|nr:uncharacterized protein LACBIDRAFT_310185 [Laccaria bicolor S238N-H82]EDR02009.1 predicted protein [Laccaria bicolor S238N-H82]|eukprot:XP_001887400.1 predicted protein [Laccaria bicolor S238N-H82]
MTFSHPTQNNLSQALKELFGIKESNTDTGEPLDFGSREGHLHESQSGDNESVHSHSHKSVDQTRKVQGGGGGGDPGDSDGDDSSHGKGGGDPHRNPRKPLTPNHSRRNPFGVASDESRDSASKPLLEPQSNLKLKVDAIPTWDGNPEGLRRWLLKVNSLAKRSQTVFKQLGTLIPTRLTGSAEI